MTSSSLIRSLRIDSSFVVVFKSGKIEEKQDEIVSEMKRANLDAFDEELREIRSKGIVDFFFILVAIFSGCVCMMLIEEWRFEQGLYWAIVTVSLLFSPCDIVLLLSR